MNTASRPTTTVVLTPSCSTSHRQTSHPMPCQQSKSSSQWTKPRRMATPLASTPLAVSARISRSVTGTLLLTDRMRAPGTWYVMDFDTEILPYVEYGSGVRAYGPHDGIRSQADAFARVSAHRAARESAATTAAAAVVPQTPSHRDVPPTTPETNRLPFLPQWASFVTDSTPKTPPGLNASRGAFEAAAQPAPVVAAAFVDATHEAVTPAPADGTRQLRTGST